MSAELYREFKRERLYDQVAEHIEDLISDGTLQSGDKLPSERELAQRLGVGRGVVREAVKLLAERGLVSVEPGRGTFIAELDTYLFSDQLGRFLRVGRHSYSDLNEVRRILEVEIASLAAQRAGVEDLERMKQAIQDMEDNITSADGYIEADLAFHQALARATKNEIFLLLIDVMVDSLRELRRLTVQVPGAPERARDWHKVIYEAVEKGDSAAAREAMWGHMQQVTKDAQASKLAGSQSGQTR